MTTTRLSNKGQVVIPKSIRAAHGWKPGVEFLVENTDEGIVLKPIKSYSPTKIHEVIGCIP